MLAMSFVPGATMMGTYWPMAWKRGTSTNMLKKEPAAITAEYLRPMM